MRRRALRTAHTKQARRGVDSIAGGLQEVLGSVTVSISSRTLAGAAVLGLGLAVTGALDLSIAGGAATPEATKTIDADSQAAVLARVGEQLLTVDDLRRALDAQREIRRDAVTADELDQILDSLIDEELLIQRAAALGLIDTDPGLRRALQVAMKEKILADVPKPSEEQLRRIFQADAARYGNRAFAEVRPRVLRDQQRQARRQALEQALEDLRAEATIERFDTPRGDH